MRVTTRTGDALSMLPTRMRRSPSRRRRSSLGARIAPIFQRRIRVDHRNGRFTVTCKLGHNRHEENVTVQVSSREEASYICEKTLAREDAIRRVLAPLACQLVLGYGCNKMNERRLWRS